MLSISLSTTAMNLKMITMITYYYVDYVTIPEIMPYFASIFMSHSTLLLVKSPYFLIIILNIWWFKSYIIYFIDDQCFKTNGPGPHPTSCLIAWWLEAGCSINGQKSPIVNNNVYWNKKKVATVKMDMSLYVQNALTSIVYVLLCYGV